MKFKNIFSVAMTLALVVVLAGTSFAAKKKVAVMGLDDGTVDHWWGDEMKVGDGISDMLVTSLVKMGRFSVIERQQLEKVMKEQSLGLSGMIDASQAKEVGKLAAVDYIITGKVTLFEVKKEEMKAGKFLGGASVETTKGLCQVDVRIVDVQTGEIIVAEQGKGESSKSGISFNQGDLAGMEFGGSDFEGTVLGAATRKAVDDIAAKFGTKAPLVGSVADVQPGKVIIDLLASEGMKKGMKVIIRKKTGSIMIKGVEKPKYEEGSELFVLEATEDYTTCGVKVQKGEIAVGDQVIVP